jgi:hypothetical protein
VYQIDTLCKFYTSKRLCRLTKEHWTCQGQKKVQQCSCRDVIGETYHSKVPKRPTRLSDKSKNVKTNIL